MSAELILVPSQDYHFFANGDAVQVGGDTNEKKAENACQFIDEFITRHPDATLVGSLGGRGDALFVRASLTGYDVKRIPLYQLFDHFGLAKNAKPEDRATAIKAAYQDMPQFFYELGALDQRIYMIREITRVRKKLQDTYRKPAQLLLKATEREMLPLSDLARTSSLVDQITAVRQIFADSQMVAGALADEANLEKRLEKLLAPLDIWQLMKDPNLVPIKGIGPALGGAFIGEIGDIRRFASSSALRAYARLHLVNNGQASFPRRKAGELANWQPYLAQAFWWWYDFQLPRLRDSVWSDLYQHRLATEYYRHPETVKKPVTKKDGSSTQVTLYGPSHLKKRAKRWTGSVLAKYIFDLWGSYARGEDTSSWYSGSHWPAWFATRSSELATPLYQTLLGQYQEYAESKGKTSEAAD